LDTVNTGQAVTEAAIDYPNYVKIHLLNIEDGPSKLVLFVSGSLR